MMEMTEFGTRETVDMEAFKELTIQKYLARYPQVSKNIISLLKQDNGELKKKLEEYFPSETATKNIIEKENEYRPQEHQFMLNGKNENGEDELTMQVFYRTGEKNAFFSKVDEVKIKKEDVTEDTMRDLEKINIETQLDMKEIELNLAETAR